MMTIPLSAVPTQALRVTLGNQSCQIRVSQRSTGVYLDLYVNNALVVGGVLCLNKVFMVRSVYLNFVGDLAFVDTIAANDPDYTGFGDRYQLMYFEASDL